MLTPMPARSEEAAALGARLRAVRGDLTQLAFADRLGVEQKSISRYETGDRWPDAAFLATVARAFAVDPGWLLTGSSAEAAAPEYPQITPHLEGVLLLGLAECGLRGWYQRDALSVRASRPGDFIDPEGFAVIAVGHSMVPAGIEQGFICYCSPRTSAADGDAIYIERSDGAATLKLYRGREDRWLVLQGWLDPEEGVQKPFTDRLLLATVRRIAPVIYVKRKL